MASFSKKNMGASLATNWMVHVCIIIILIISFVLYDKITSRKPKSSITTKSAPSANNTSYGSRTEQASPDLPDNSEEPTPPVEESASNTKAARRTGGNSKPNAEVAVSEESTAPGKNRGEKRSGIQVSFYKITKQGIADLQKISQAINIAGDSIGGALPAERVPQMVSSGEMQYLSGNRYKDFDEKHPTVVFKGQRHSEAARNMGLFFQVTSVLRKNENTQLIEVKGWGALKASEADENYFTGEMTLTPRNTAFVTGFLPRGGTYTDDEKQLFETDRVLKTLIQDDFTDGSTDIIMFIEFSKSN
ncbi:MAG: hypothetical protein IT287_05035 [Bdellovibrionaceae bacterium]|nr:hypothetical protein [Pseudobdellovibrionaceae bacterium]